VTTTTDNDFSKWLPWVAVAVLAYFVFNKQPSVDPVVPTPTPQPTQSISKVLDSCHAADRLSKIAVLKGIGATEFPTDKAKLEWINSESEKRRIADFQPYVDRVAEAIFAGKTADLAKALEDRK
jgi:hypothetical protein